MSATSTGINDLQNETSFTIAPNPFTTNSVINLTLNKKSKVEFEVINSLGQTISKLEKSSLTKGNYSYNLSGNNSNGIYMLILKIDDHMYSQKIIEIRQ